MTRLVTPRKNRFEVSGIIVKNDAFVNDNRTVARFRIAACSGSREEASPFFDVVHFKPKDSVIDMDLLRRGRKVMIDGYFHVNSYNGADKLELVATSVRENVPVEVEVEDGVDVDVDDLPEE